MMLLLCHTPSLSGDVFYFLYFTMRMILSERRSQIVLSSKKKYLSGALSVIGSITVVMDIFINCVLAWIDATDDLLHILTWNPLGKFSRGLKLISAQHKSHPIVLLLFEQWVAVARRESSLTTKPWKLGIFAGRVERS
jgi:hypothetical protein